jgi:type IV pilus assembly protein PilQ
MINFLKLKKSKTVLYLFLIFNQFISSANAFNFGKEYLINQNSNINRKKNNNEIYISSINKTNNFEQGLMKEAKEIEKFVEETFGQDDFENLIDQNNEIPLKPSNLEFTESEFMNKEKNKTKKEQKEKEEINDIKPKIKKQIIKKKDNSNNLPLPSRSKISTSEFTFPSRGYVKLTGPKITLNLQGADSIETLKLIGKLGNYGIVIIDENNEGKEEIAGSSKITASFNGQDISDVFNSILLSANLQAVLEKNIIFIGKNILTKSLKPKFSKTYRLNQVNAASVADYLSTLGATISKVLLVSGSIDGTEVNDSYVNKKELNDDLIDTYSIAKGPLSGLFGTADLRLQTITLIGSKDLVKTAEKYIKSLDVRHRQVALTIKIIDVSLTKADIKENMFEYRTGATRAIINSGLALTANNMAPGLPGDTFSVQAFEGGSVSNGKFINWLQAKITNENAKILASPTLILGENPNLLSSGAAQVDDGLSVATIGRPFKNEGFIKVGETVVTSFSKSIKDGVVTCEPEEGTAGITFGAKVEKIDDNGYVTFALSPAISSVTKTSELPNCGIQNTLSVRKLDTGIIRVKNGETLILTGVLQDSDNVATSKVPILGDIPILGSLFRSNQTTKRKSELIILVTPKILKDK